MKFSNLLIATVVVFSSAFAFAKTSKTVTYTSTSSSSGSFFSDWSDKELSLTGTAGTFETYKVGSSSVTSIDISAALAMLVYEHIQAGAEVNFVSISGGSVSSSGVGILAFGTYNFDYSIKESLYAKAGLGSFMVQNTAGGSDNKFGFMAGIGKRIPMWEKVTYAPEARLMKIGDLDMQFKIMFLNFTYMF